MILIGINKSSIKRNLNAGRTQMKVLGKREMSFHVTGELPDILKDEKNAFISESITSNDSPDEHKGYITNFDIFPDVCTMADNKDNHISVEMHNEWNTIMFPPEDRYFFKHLNVKVKCMNCNHQFMSNDFVEMDNDDSCNFHYTDTGCPECRAWDCCNVRYESIHEVESKYLPKA